MKRNHSTTTIVILIYDQIQRIVLFNLYYPNTDKTMLVVFHFIIYPCKYELKNSGS